MGFSFRYVSSLLVLIALQACGAATPSSEIGIRLVRPSGSVSVSDATNPVNPANPTQVLSSEHCYFVHVTAASDTLTKLSVPGACTSSPRKVGLTTPETYNIGDMVKLMVPSGPQRRIDLVGVPKSRLQVTSCPKNLGFLANSQNPALSKFRIGGVDVALNELTLYASTVKDLGVGLEVVDLPYTNLAVGTSYFCGAQALPVGGGPLVVDGPPAFLDFGIFAVGGAAPWRTITLRNTSTDVTVTGITGQNLYTNWSFREGTFPGTGGTCATTLAPSSSCTLNVEYYPYSTGGRLAGVKNFPLQIAYTYNGEPQIATLPSQANVTPGMLTTLCLLKGTEIIDANGQCPSGNIPAPSFSSRSYTVSSYDEGGNPVTAANNTELTIVSSDPYAASVNITLSAGTNSTTFTIQHGREPGVVQNLSVSSAGGGLNTYRPLLITSVCGWPATHGDFQAGTGIATDPYLICNPSQFEKIETTPAYRAAHYKLAQEINLAGSTFLPLGTTADTFSGVLDGNGYEIRNPTRDLASNNLGLFASINNAILRNLLVIDPNFSGLNNVGTLAGEASGNSLIEKNAVVFSQTAKSLGTQDLSTSVGGLVGQINHFTVLRDNTVHLGSILSESRILGRGPIGGLVGSASGSPLIERNSVAGLGTIKSVHSSGEAKVAGLLGAAFAASVAIRDSRVGEGVSLNSHGSTRNSVGGLVGLLYGLVENSYFLGNIIVTSSTTTDRIGGIAAETVVDAIIQSVLSHPSSVSAPNGLKGAIVGSNASSTVCSIGSQGCLYTSAILDFPCPSPPGTTCSTHSYPTNSLTAASFSAPFGSDALTYGSNKWMFDVTSGKVARQWERVAQLDPSFIDSTKSKVSLSGLQGSFFASTGKGALRSNICKTSGQWYWETTVVKGDWGEEFGIIAQTQSNPGNELSFYRPAHSAWSLRDIAGSFAPYIGSGLDPTYSGGNYRIVPKNGTTSVRPEMGDVVGIRIDLQSTPKKIQYFLNGVALTQLGGNTLDDTQSGTITGAYCAAVGKGETTSIETVYDVNFGTRPFRYPANITSLVKPYNFLE